MIVIYKFKLHILRLFMLFSRKQQQQYLVSKVQQVSASYRLSWSSKISLFKIFTFSLFHSSSNCPPRFARHAKNRERNITFTICTWWFLMFDIGCFQCQTVSDIDLVSSDDPHSSLLEPPFDTRKSHQFPFRNFGYFKNISINCGNPYLHVSSL